MNNYHLANLLKRLLYELSTTWTSTKKQISDLIEVIYTCINSNAFRNFLFLIEFIVTMYTNTLFGSHFFSSLISSIELSTQNLLNLNKKYYCWYLIIATTTTTKSYKNQQYIRTFQQRPSSNTITIQPNLKLCKNL